MVLGDIRWSGHEEEALMNGLSALIKALWGFGKHLWPRKELASASSHRIITWGNALLISDIFPY